MWNARASVAPLLHPSVPNSAELSPARENIAEVWPKYSSPSRSRRRVRPVDGQVVIDAVQRNEKCKFIAAININTHTDIVPNISDFIL